MHYDLIISLDTDDMSLEITRDYGMSVQAIYTLI